MGGDLVVLAADSGLQGGIERGGVAWVQMNCSVRVFAGGNCSAKDSCAGSRCSAGFAAASAGQRLAKRTGRREAQASDRGVVASSRRCCLGGWSLATNGPVSFAGRGLTSNTGRAQYMHTIES